MKDRGGLSGWAIWLQGGSNLAMGSLPCHVACSAACQLLTMLVSKVFDFRALHYIKTSLTYRSI